MRQLLYVSLSSVTGREADLAGILEQSRHCNAIDGITGLLWYDGTRFMQVLEGPRVSVGAALSRIITDPRHHSLEILSNHHVENRAFGDWTMAYHRAGEQPDVHRAAMRRLLVHASDTIRAQFNSRAAAGLFDRPPESRPHY